MASTLLRRTTRPGDRCQAKRQRKLERSVRPFGYGRSGRFEQWFSDLAGGAPTLPAPATEEHLHE